MDEAVDDSSSFLLLFFFFFQAEDGIRDLIVTGVQTCALPISAVTGAAIFELLVAVYGGYFGGGIGIMNLAMLAAMGMTDIHAMNKLKVILGEIGRASCRERV